MTRSAGDFCHLHDHRPDAAAAAVDEDRFAHFQLRFAKEPQMSRDANQGARGRLFIGYVGWRRVEPMLIDRAVFGERSLAAQESLVRAPDAVADFESFRLRAGGLDRAGQIAADNERLGQFPIVGAVAEIGVDRVDRDSAGADEDLGASRLRRGHIAEFDRGFGSRWLRCRRLSWRVPWLKRGFNSDECRGADRAEKLPR